MSEKKKEKVYKSLDKDDWSEKINLIVDELHKQALSRDYVTELVNSLNSIYGIKKPVIRAVARTVFKHNLNEFEEQSQEVLELVRRV